MSRVQLYHSQYRNTHLSKHTIALLHSLTGVTLDMICRCAFGIDIDVYRNPDHELAKNGREAFATLRPDSWLLTAIMQAFFHFPGAERFLPVFPPAFDNLFDITTRLMKQRLDQV